MQLLETSAAAQYDTDDELKAMSYFGLHMKTNY